MSFGFSISDIIAIGAYTAKAIELVRVSRTAHRDCNDTISLIHQYSTAIQEINQLVADYGDVIPTEHAETTRDVKKLVEDCRLCITRFVDGNKKFIEGFSHPPALSASNDPFVAKLRRQIFQLQWALKSSEIVQLRSALFCRMYPLQFVLQKLQL